MCACLGMCVGVGFVFNGLDSDNFTLVDEREDLFLKSLVQIISEKFNSLGEKGEGTNERDLRLLFVIVERM